MKGKISPALDTILRDSEGRKKLRQSLVRGGINTIDVGHTRYQISSKDIHRTSAAAKVAQKEEGLANSTVNVIKKEEGFASSADISSR